VISVTRIPWNLLRGALGRGSAIGYRDQLTRSSGDINDLVKSPKDFGHTRPRNDQSKWETQGRSKLAFTLTQLRSARAAALSTTKDEGTATTTNRSFFKLLLAFAASPDRFAPFRYIKSIVASTFQSSERYTRAKHARDSELCTRYLSNALSVRCHRRSNTR